MERQARQAWDAAEEAEALGETWADIEAAAAGDTAAFERLYRAYAPMVHAIAIAHAPHPEGEDIVQDVFITAWHQLGRLQDLAAFGSWLAQIGRRRAIDRLRRRRPTEPLVEEPVAATSTSQAAEAVAILGAIRTLAPAYRETLVMRLVHGMTGPEIAMKTGMTAGSVRVNLHRGMTQLRRALQGGRSDD